MSNKCEVTPALPSHTVHVLCVNMPSNFVEAHQPSISYFSALYGCARVTCGPRLCADASVVAVAPGTSEIAAIFRCKSEWTVFFLCLFLGRTRENIGDCPVNRMCLMVFRFAELCTVSFLAALHVHAAADRSFKLSTKKPTPRIA